jgi:thiosulfate dehydrogenase
MSQSMRVRLCVALATVSLPLGLRAQTLPAHTLPPAKKGGMVVGLCDGVTHVEVEGVKDGQPLDRARAQAVSAQLMAKWQAKNPNVRWEVASAQTSASGQGARGREAQAGPPAGSQPGAQRGVYSSYSGHDEEVWARETQKFVDEGNAIFHDAKRFGGTIGVSCDMCHPNAANTHPETYPKYQAQLQRVALLRDMINWCVGNPAKGKPLPDDDRRLRAMEAYILAQRKGTKLEFGKH